jgi:hypothetical protein
LVTQLPLKFSKLSFFSVNFRKIARYLSNYALFLTEDPNIGRFIIEAPAGAPAFLGRMRRFADGLDLKLKTLVALGRALLDSL